MTYKYFLIFSLSSLLMLMNVYIHSAQAAEPAEAGAAGLNIKYSGFRVCLVLCYRCNDE